MAQHSGEMVMGDCEMNSRFNQEINVLALVKGHEQYVFLFNDDNRTEVLRQIGKFARNDELSFTWYDAAVMSQKIRSLAKANSESCGDSITKTHRISRRFE